LAKGDKIVAIVSATTTAGTSCAASGFTNTATGKATGVSDVTASAVTKLNCPSLDITKLPATQTKSAGESFSWTVTLTNNGDGTATGAKIDDPLPTVTGVSYSLASSSPAGANCAIDATGTPVVLKCGPLDLAKGDKIVAIVSATTTAGTSCAASGFTNTATGKATGVSDVTASAETKLNCPSIGITKTPATQTVTAGGSFSWTVTLTNSGAGIAYGAKISDPLPTVAGVAYTLGSSSPSTANCAITAVGTQKTLNCGPLDLAQNDKIVAVVSATTTAGTGCSTFTNTATGSATNLTDVTASASTTLNNCAGGLIAPTQTSCEAFAGGNRIAEPFIAASLRNGAISNVSPGVIFYYTKLTVGAGTYTVKQSDVPNAGSALPLIQVSQGQAYVLTYNATLNKCTNVGTFNLSNPNLPTITLGGGDYIVQIKYSPKSLVGATATASTFPVVYSWVMQSGGVDVGGTSAKVNVLLK
jgi:uncharacterized repeat protein (TIGR01451 family)